MTVQNTHRSYVGIAKETTKGTAVTTPTNYIPVMANSLKPQDIYTPLYDEGLRGSLVKNYNYIQGRVHSTFDFSGAAFADTIGFPIAGLLGEDVLTGASAPYTHTIALKNTTATASDAQPAAFTLLDYYGANVRTFTGQQFHDFTLKWNADGLLEYDAKSTGYKSATASTPTPSFSTILPTPVWYGTVTIGGSTISNNTMGNIDMKRPVTPIYGISNVQTPYSVFVGALEVTGKATFLMESDTELTRYLTNTQPSLTFNWSYGTGATAVQISATMTKGAYTLAVVERSKDFVEVLVDFNAQGNLTDSGSVGYSPIKWTIQNALSSAYL
jgi:Phage tail tube protein